MTDRLPYRATSGDLQAVVVRWACGIDPKDALSALATMDASGLCAAETARLADPPQPPPGWHHHPLIGEKEIYAPSERGITAHGGRTVGIIRKPADAALTPTLRLRWSWRRDELPSRLPEDIRAWLIAVSCFQMGEGRGEFGRIELVDGDEVIRVLGAPGPASE